jgi:hypothetical protein
MQLEYNWRGIRDWCLWYIRLFLEYADRLDTKLNYDAYYAQLGEHPIDWRKIKQIPNKSVRAVLESITSTISEAVPTKTALSPFS